MTLNRIFIKQTLCVCVSLLVFCSITGCKKLIEIEPPIQDVVGKEIYKNSNTATSVVIGIYTDLNNYGSFLTGRSGMSLRFGLAADELAAVSSPEDILTTIYTNSITRDDGNIWADLYGYVFRVNAAIEGIEGSPGIGSAVKKQLLGELKFLRAFFYFYLVNTYGDVPLLLTTDVKYNTTAPRTSTASVYEQIISDLTFAKASLNPLYVGADGVSSSIERIRPNKSVAGALLSRVYLYAGNWTLAEAEASEVIGNSMFKLETIDRAFLLDSKEAIWQLQTVAASVNTLDAPVFVLDEHDGIPAGPDMSSRPSYMSKSLFDSFSEQDLRKSSWIGRVTIGTDVYPFSYKYKAWILDETKTEYLIVFRLSEQYLIRAEARANSGKLTGENSAESDLNTVRQRANLSPITSTSSSDVLNEIFDERRRELFTEFGHRWFDLKRSTRINAVMNSESLVKGSVWAPYKSLYPIPVNDILTNPALRGHQNPGYPER